MVPHRPFVDTEVSCLMSHNLSAMDSQTFPLSIEGLISRFDTSVFRQNITSLVGVQDIIGLFFKPMYTKIQYKKCKHNKNKYKTKTLATAKQKVMS